MRRLLFIITILVPALAWGQRTYISKHGYYDDIYVIEDKEGALTIHFQVRNEASYRDSLFIVLDREGCREMQDYYKALNRAYKKWNAIAKTENVRGFNKEFNIDAPVVNIKWRPEYKVDYFTHLHHDSVRYGEMSLHPVFYVSEKGSTFIKEMTCASNLFPAYDIEIYYSSSRSLIRRFDYDRIEREYRRIRPPQPSREELDEMFK